MSFLLTRERVRQAWKILEPSVLAGMECGLFHRRDLHVVVVDGTMRLPGHTFRDAVIWEKSLGRQAEWEHPYLFIARAKAYATWRTSRSTPEMVRLAPQLLEHGDTIYDGSVYLNGVIAAASGQKSHFDFWIASAMATLSQQLCVDEMERIREAGESPFLGPPDESLMVETFFDFPAES